MDDLGPGDPAGGFRANLHDVLDDADDVMHRGDLLGGGLGAEAGQTLLDEFVPAVLHDGRRGVGERSYAVTADTQIETTFVCLFVVLGVCLFFLWVLW